MKATKCVLADSAIKRQPGHEPEFLKGKQIDREIARMGLFMERYDVEDDAFSIFYDSRQVIIVNGIKYVFGNAVVLHKGDHATECLSEEEACRAVIFLMDSEIDLNYDGVDFKAYELFD